MATVDEDLISSLYPPPPVYYKFFTEENLEKLKEWKEQRTDKSTSDGKPEEHQNEKSEQNEEVKEETAESTNIEKPKPSKSPNAEETAVDEVLTSEVPGELKFLVPPKQPEGTHYRGYGNIWAFEDKLPTLKDTNWEQLYKDDDELITSETKIKELHKLMDSLLLNFLELIGIVSIDPQQFEHKVKDLSLILININHLLNTYRPHQSRESLIMLLRKQIEAKQQEIARIEQVSQSVKSKILGLAESIDESGTNDMDIEQKSEDSSTEVRQQEIVQALLAKHL